MSDVESQRSNVNNAKLLSERTSGDSPVNFCKAKRKVQKRQNMFHFGQTPIYSNFSATTNGRDYVIFPFFFAQSRLVKRDGAM